MTPSSKTRLAQRARTIRVALLAMLGALSPVLAEAQEATSPVVTSAPDASMKADEPSPLRHTLATAGSVVPGLLLHGSGHVVLGEYRTGLKLMGAQAAGFALLLGGISGLAVTGAADEFVPPLYWTAMTGAGLFFFSWGLHI